MKIREYDLTSF